MDKHEILICIIAVAFIASMIAMVVSAKQEPLKINSTINIKTERIDGTYYKLITLPDGRRFIAYTHWVIPLDTVEPHASIEKE